MRDTNARAADRKGRRCFWQAAVWESALDTRSASGYQLPRDLVRAIGRDILLGRRRSFSADCDRLVDAMPVRPAVLGREYIPVNGPFVLIANHLEGPGLWIGWGAALLTHAVGWVRPDPVPVHWLVQRELDRSRVRGLKRYTPGASLAFRRVARAWSMVALPRQGSPAARAAAVRSLLRIAAPPPIGRGRPTGFFPEGADGSLRGLGKAHPGSGALLALLGRWGVPVVPAALCLDGNRLTAEFGVPFLASDRDHAADQAMAAIARLLPPSHTGGF